MNYFTDVSQLSEDSAIAEWHEQTKVTELISRMISNEGFKIWNAAAAF